LNERRYAMPETKYAPVRHDHKIFLEKGFKRNGPQA
jgi:hypothetical protein